MVYTEVAILPRGTILYEETPNSSLRIRDDYPGPKALDPGSATLRHTVVHGGKSSHMLPVNCVGLTVTKRAKSQ
jgi:hypothetical protein